MIWWTVAIFHFSFSTKIFIPGLLLVGKGSCDIEVVDVGAGTGIWTRMVYDKGVKKVKAVENCDDMRKQGIIDSGGDELCVEWKIKNHRGEFVKNTTGNLLQHSFCFDLGE